MFFFFSSRRRHTRLQGDWSSDVCSSDLRRKRCSKRLAGSRWSWTGLKTKLVCSIEHRRALVELAHPDLSIRRQCELLGVNRARPYYQPGGEGEENLRLMRLLDEQYTRTPFYGRRRMTVWLRSQGFEVNPKRVVRLMERTNFV